MLNQRASDVASWAAELNDPNTNVFGMSLQTAMQLETVHSLLPSQTIPTVLDLILSNLDVKRIEAEVLLSADPNDIVVQKKKLLLRLGSLPITMDEDPQILAGLLKLYLQELPEPLIPIKCYNKVIDLVHKKFKGVKDKGDGVTALKELVATEFPPVNNSVCFRILEIFKKTMTDWWANENDSKAIIDAFAPYFLRAEPSVKSVTPKERQLATSILGVLSLHYEAIFVQDTISPSGRRMSLIQRGEKVSRRSLSSTDLAGLMANSPASKTDNEESKAQVRRMKSFVDNSPTSSPDNSLKKSPRKAKVKAQDVLLILDTENAKLKREITSHKDWAQKAISELTIQLQTVTNELQETQALLAKVLTIAAPDLKAHLTFSTDGLQSSASSTASISSPLEVSATATSASASVPAIKVE